MTARSKTKETPLDDVEDADDDGSNPSSEDEEYLSDEEYVVEEVLAEKFEDGVNKYLLSWADYPEEENTWEPKENIRDPDLLKAWRQRKKLQEQGLVAPYDVIAFETKMKKLQVQQKSTQQFTEGISSGSSDSDISPDEEHSPTRSLNEGRSAFPVKKPQSPVETKLATADESSSDEEPRPASRRSSRQEHSAKSSEEPTQRPQRADSEVRSPLKYYLRSTILPLD